MIVQHVLGTIARCPLFTWHIQSIQNSSTSFCILRPYCPTIIVHKSRMLIPRRSFTDWYEFGSHWFPHALSLVLGIIARPVLTSCSQIVFVFSSWLRGQPAPPWIDADPNHIHSASPNICWRITIPLVTIIRLLFSPHVHIDQWFTLILVYLVYISTI